MIRLLLLVICLPLVPSMSFASMLMDKMDKEEALVAHEAGQQACRMLSCDLKMLAPKQPTKSNQKEWMRNPDLRVMVPFFELHWVLDGKRERLKIVPLIDMVNGDGLPQLFEDVYRDEEKEFSLRNWDPMNPQKITPIHQGSVRAEIRDFRASEFRRLDPAWFLLRLPRFELVEPRLTLRGFIERFKKVDYSVLPSGDYRFELRDDSMGIIAPDYEVIVDLSPKAGFSISRLGKWRDPEDGVELSVLSFRSYGSGIFLPDVVEQTNFSPDFPSGLKMNRMEVKVSSVNQAIDSSEFVFDFPENVQVVDLSAGEKERKLLIWGADGKPKDQILGPADLEKYGSLESPPENTGAKWFFIINFVILVGGIAFVVYRRRRRAP